MMSHRRRLQVFFSFLVFGMVGSIVWACGGYGVMTHYETPDLVRELGELSRGSSVVHSGSRKWAIVETLRERRQDGLDAAVDYRNLREKELGGTDFAEIENLDRAIDKIAGQKFAAQSRLFWHTSMDSAMDESRVSGRPILSLRMLGRLDEDLSCANSRFFRTTLYPDPEIATKLRERFVLHWQPVRDVPVVTIDFGNGRELRQPLTGNSVHVVLDTHRRPIDALPGLVSPQAFKVWLDETDKLWNETRRIDDRFYWPSVVKFHRERAERRRSESSLAIGETQQVVDLNPLDPRWSTLASKHQVRLASVSQQLLRAQRPDAEAPMRLAATKSMAEIPMLRLVQPIEPAIARDTVFNLYALQTKIDDWFTSTMEPESYDAITNRIYADVFLMPLSDPWLGLSTDTYHTALDNGGRFEKSDLTRFRKTRLDSMVSR